MTKSNNPKYFCFRTHSLLHKGRKAIDLELLKPPVKVENGFSYYGEEGWTSGIRSPLMMEPYGVDLKIGFKTHDEWEHPDNYPTFAGFQVYSERLVNLMYEFDVKFEAFPVALFNQEGEKLEDLKYYIFHHLEGNLDAINLGKSESFTDKYGDTKYKKVVLDYSKFEPRPLFFMNGIYTSVMREDVRQAIKDRGMTGFGFLDLDKYDVSEYGLMMDYDD
jgi:hypothetical protein